MARRLTVTSIAEWCGLPEISLPEITNEGTPGLVLEVQKIGFLCAPRPDCHALGIQVPAGSGEQCFLPTAVVRTDQGTEELWRLPLELASWAHDCVALAGSGIKLLPSKIEFGVLRGRAYAQIR